MQDSSLSARMSCRLLTGRERSEGECSCRAQYSLFSNLWHVRLVLKLKISCGRKKKGSGKAKRPCQLLIQPRRTVKIISWDYFLSAAG